ncbi:hypothetical protein SUGI_0415110 [Cryptomeria japonica]|nr:hypothetical protein SUGI_0415110 [Cryptomeria japonica]
MVCRASKKQKTGLPFTLRGRSFIKTARRIGLLTSVSSPNSGARSRFETCTEVRWRGRGIVFRFRSYDKDFPTKCGLQTYKSKVLQRLIEDWIVLVANLNAQSGYADIFSCLLCHEEASLDGVNGSSAQSISV